MAVTLREQPNPLDFAGNGTRFLLKGTPVLTAGSRSRSVWRVSALPSSVLTVGFGGTVLDFQISMPYQAKDNALRIAAYTDTGMLRSELTTKIAGNYTIARLYDVTVADDLTITFLSKDYGGETVTLDGNGSGDIEQVEQTTGVARVQRPNYGVLAWFEVTRYNGGAVQELATPDMILHLGADNIAELPLEILRHYFAAADVPSLTETFNAYPLLYATLKYRLAYTDVSGEIPQAGVVKRSQECILTAGRLDDSHHALNLADWQTSMGASATLSEYKDIRDFASPTGLTVRTYTTLPQYAYFLLFNIYQDNAHTKSLAVRVDVRTKDGHTFPLDMGSVTVQNYNIVRIPLSPSALGIPSADDVLSYTVTAQNASGAVWARTFVLERKPHGAQEFLLQNRHGLLETLSTYTSAVEEETDGSDTVKNGVVGADITDTATVHTARTGYKPEREIQLVADAMRGRFNYRIIDGRAVPIAILPDTLTVTDTAEDLLEAEFQYRFNKPSTAKTGNLPVNPGTVEKWDDELIWRDDIVRTSARQNEIATHYNRTR